MSNMKKNHHQKFRISYPMEKKNLATGIKDQLVLGKNSKDKVKARGVEGVQGQVQVHGANIFLLNLTHFLNI